MPVNPAQTLRSVASGLLAGVAAAVTVLVFRWSVEQLQILVLPAHRVGAYEALQPWARLALVTGASLLLGLALRWVPPAYRNVGVVHVYHRIHGPGRVELPLPNAVVQFLGGTVALVGGLSVDREGPGVHLGAAAAHRAAQGLHPDEHEGRVVAGCGAAAAIAAAFNTPLAGIVFVIEVLQLRYEVQRFLPVMLAAVTGAVLSRLAYGPEPAFQLPHTVDAPITALGWLLLLGIVTGLAAAAFIALVRGIARSTLDWDPLPSMLLAGLATGVSAFAAPEIMGGSYDSMARILTGQYALQMAVVILGCKLVATAVAVGLRVPGGLIGPSLVMGAALGCALGLLVEGTEDGFPVLYPLVGMLAMMGATLQAPLAALTALLELTGHAELILPGTVAIIGADLVSRQLLGQDSVFLMLTRILREREAPVPQEPPR